MPFNLLLLPLLSGYLFTHLTYCTRFRAYGLSSYRLILNSALYGLGFVVVSHFVTRVILKIDGLEEPITLWKEFAPFPYAGSAVGSLGVAGATSLIVNLIRDRTASSGSAITRHGDSLMKLLHSAQKEKKTVMLTLSDKKVYVGFVALDLNLKPEMPYVSILPTASGYREKDTLRVHLTVSYGDIYGQIAGGLRDDVIIDDFQVLVPTSMIVSARIFSLKVYREYFGDQPAPQETRKEEDPSSNRKPRTRAKERKPMSAVGSRSGR